MLSRMLTFSVTIVLAAGLAVVWVSVVKTLTEPSTGPPTVGQPSALVWDGRVFTSPGQVKAYLNAHGLSYRRWAARHPTAFGAPAPAVIKHTTTTKTHTTSKSRPSTAVTHRVAAPTGLGTKSRSLTATGLTILLLLVGLGLAASTMLPVRLAPVALQRFYAEPDRRMLAFAAATAILLGFGVSLYLT